MFIDDRIYKNHLSEFRSYFTSFNFDLMNSVIANVLKIYAYLKPEGFLDLK